MNPQLHHKLNAVRDNTRGSGKEGEEILKSELEQNKVLLKQNKPK